MDRGGEVVLDKVARFPREIIWHQAEFVNAVSTSGAQQACCFGNDGHLLILALHRQHGFTINHARLCIRQARLVRTRNEALTPEALKAMSNDPSGLFIAFNPDVGMRLSGKGQAGSYPETWAKFDYIIVGLNVQAVEHTPGKFETAGP